MDIVKNLQRIRGLDGEYDNDSGSSSGNVGRRKTIHNLENNMKRKRTIGTLDVAFKERFFKMKEENGKLFNGKYTSAVIDCVTGTGHCM